MSTQDWLITASSSKIFEPCSYDHLQEFILTHDGPFSIAGAQYSSGGQSLVKDGFIISLARLAKLVKIRPVYSSQDIITYRVSAGTTWKEVLSELVRYGLVPWSMQSYHNFTVGGSISVNAHGRNGRRVSDGLLSLTVMTMDGRIYECTPGSELFEGVVGGYGLIGIILEALFRADYNIPLKCQISVTSGEDLAQDLFTNFEEERGPVLYNAELSFTEDQPSVVHVSWYKHPNKIKTSPLIQRSTPLTQMLTRIGEATLYVIPGSTSIYHTYHWMNLQGQSRMLSYEMGYDASNLIPMFSWRVVQSLLQEYFLTNQQVGTFIKFLQTHLQTYRCISLLNLSIRSVQSKPCGLLDWLPRSSSDESVYAVVIYFGLNDLTTQGWALFEEFTQELVDCVLQLNGTWYLPYCPYFTKKALVQGYPRIKDWLTLKQRFDPQTKLQSLFGQYLMDST